MRAAIVAVDPRLLDEGAALAHPHPGAERQAGCLRGAPRTHRPPALPDPAAQTGGRVRRLPGPAGSGVPHRRAGAGPGQRRHPRRPAGATVAGAARARAGAAAVVAKYSAHEHNPIERAWGLLKDAVAANRLHGSIEELIAVADHFLATTSFQAPNCQPDADAPAVAA